MIHRNRVGTQNAFSISSFIIILIPGNQLSSKVSIITRTETASTKSSDECQKGNPVRKFFERLLHFYVTLGYQNDKSSRLGIM